MDIVKIIEAVKQNAISSNDLVNITIGDSLKVKTYPFSVVKLNNSYFLLIKENLEKYLLIVEEKRKPYYINYFDGTEFTVSNDLIVKKSEFTTKNRKTLRILCL